MKLENLLKNFPKGLLELEKSFFPGSLEETLNIEIDDVVYDSRRAKPNTIFVAISGYKSDGNSYIKDAIDNGSTIIVISRAIRDKMTISGEGSFRFVLGSGNSLTIENIRDISLLVVREPRKALAHLSAALFQFPWQSQKIVGITGTNGKTSIAYILDHIWKTAGLESGIIGTIECRWKGNRIPSENTTPESRELAEMVYKMAKQNISRVAMEVSSHALFLSRVDAFRFSAGIFTNLTQDHLDFHENFENYFESKKRLFEPGLLDGPAIVNIDDPFGRRIGEYVESYGGKVFSLTTNQKDQLGKTYLLKELKYDMGGTSFTLELPAGDSKDLDKNQKFHTHLKGRFNAINVSLSIIAAIQSGIEPDVAREAISKEEMVIPGRFEVIRAAKPSGFLTVVDYAHTPDALKNVLEGALELKPKRLITLFGCGGDRDRKKRPLMGRIAQVKSDYSIVTSDNPRTEDPFGIISDIEEGMDHSLNNYEVIPDRKEAIISAVKLCKSGDILVIAGKGHENYQILGEKKIHFDDREVAQLALESL